MVKCFASVEFTTGSTFSRQPEVELIPSFALSLKMCTCKMYHTDYIGQCITPCVELHFAPILVCEL